MRKLSRINHGTNPTAYFITFTTYGTWLHGDARSSINAKENKVGLPKLKNNLPLLSKMQSNLKNKPIILNANQRIIVLNAIESVCEHYSWLLYAAHVRSNHVHIVLRSEEPLSKILSQIKAYASRELRKTNNFSPQEKIWTRHASTRYIWFDNLLTPVMRYVIDEQGEKMACFSPSWYEQMMRDS